VEWSGLIDCLCVSSLNLTQPNQTLFFDSLRIGKSTGEGVGFDPSGVEKIRRAVCEGLCTNAAKLHSDGKYRTVKNNILVELDSQGVLANFGKSPEYVVYSHTVDNPASRQNTVKIQVVTAINGMWFKNSKLYA